MRKAEASSSPNSPGMQAVTPRGGRQQRDDRRRSHRPVVAQEEEEEDSSVNGGGDADNHPGAFAVGGRRSGEEEADDAFTISQQPESVAAPLLPERGERTTNAQHYDDIMNIPIASEAVVDEDPPPIVTAEPTEPRLEEEEDEEPSIWISKRGNKFILLAFVLLVVGIVVAVVIPLSGEGGNNSRQGSGGQDGDDDVVSAEGTPTPTVSPTLSPAPTSLNDRLSDLISTYTARNKLEDSTTPQFQAFQWVVGDAESGYEEWTDEITLERYALATLFFATGGFRWISVENFLLQETCCAWDGVECTDEVITSLSLPSENLSGSLPPEIGLLISLTSLHLSNNPLTGSIPIEIGFLTNLELMDISGKDVLVDDSNNLDGRFLRRRLDDTLPSSTALTGPIPSEIGLITSLVSLDISNNQLTGNIPSEIGLLDDIRTIALQNNRLDGAIPIQFSFLANLEELFLQKNLLTGGVPNSLCSSTFSSIQTVSSDCLPETNGDKESEVVCNCCNICCDVNDVCRDLDVTSFPSSSPSTYLPSTSPSRAPTKLPSTKPSEFPRAMPSPIQIPSAIPSFAPSMSLSSAFDEMLAFAQTISDSNALEDPNSAQYLAVEWLAEDKVVNRSNWTGYELLQRYVLRVLYHSTGGDNWDNNARSFWFRASRVCDWIAGDAQCRGDDQQVDLLQLSYDNLQGTIPAELGQLTALKMLGLSTNNLTATIPTQLGQLTALTLMTLSQNQLTGTIPLASTQLTDLRNLYLHNNNLTGQVPSGFCSSPFPDWSADGSNGNQLWVDCLNEVECDCCDLCW